MKILIVDDEVKIVRGVRKYLEGSGFSVVEAYDGLSGLSMARRENPDLIVLDLMLPEMDGLDVCRRIRQESNVPIIMLTARVEESDKLVGLELGADDYVTKPFSPRELVARVRAVLRRSAHESYAADKVYHFQGVVFDPQAHVLTVNGRDESLTPIEFDLLYHFIQHRNKACSRLQLMDAAGLGAFEGAERTIDVHIHNLRKKIEKDPANPQIITTVFGMGYRFTADLERA
jgi:two-component system alkaline phosphatase synthesis response regulator PhoP